MFLFLGSLKRPFYVPGSSQALNFWVRCASSYVLFQWAHNNLICQIALLQKKSIAPAEESKEIAFHKIDDQNVLNVKVWISTSHTIKDTGKGTDSYVGTFPVIFCDLRSCILV